MNSFSPEVKKTELSYKEKADINRVFLHFSFSFIREQIGNMVKKKEVKNNNNDNAKNVPLFI